MNKKLIPIGISDYKKLIEENYYFVDKTDFIRQIIEEGALITMLPRPRRFGKTLNLSMLRYFFERTEGNLFRSLFDGMNITKWKDFDRYQGKYPVILITLKDCKGETFEQTLEQVGNELRNEFNRHAYLLESMDTLTDHKETFLRILKRQASPNELTDSLRLLTDLLTTHWGISPLVLFDEYDSPIQVRRDMEVLLKGDSLRYVINDKLAFPDLLKSADNIWQNKDWNVP